MNLSEIRRLVEKTTSEDWHVLSGDAPTYIGRWVLSRDGEGQEFTQHESRAVLRDDLDVGLAWGLDLYPYEADDEQYWTKGHFLQGAQAVYGHVVEVLYRGQPVDRQVYALVDNAHGLVPWPTPQYASSSPGLGADPDALTVTAWHHALTLLLGALGSTGRVDEYMHRLGITVAG